MRIKWCTSHYTSEFCKMKVRELREIGKYNKVWTSDYLKEDGKTYCRIYVDTKN